MLIYCPRIDTFRENAFRNSWSVWPDSDCANRPVRLIASSISRFNSACVRACSRASSAFLIARSWARRDQPNIESASEKRAPPTPIAPAAFPSNEVALVIKSSDCTPTFTVPTRVPSSGCRRESASANRSKSSTDRPSSPLNRSPSPRPLGVGRPCCSPPLPSPKRSRRSNGISPVIGNRPPCLCAWRRISPKKSPTTCSTYPSGEKTSRGISMGPIRSAISSGVSSGKSNDRGIVGRSGPGAVLPGRNGTGWP